MRIRFSHIATCAFLLAFVGFSPSIAEAGCVFSSDASSSALFTADTSFSAGGESDRARRDKVNRLLSRLFDLTFDQAPATSTGTHAPPSPPSGPATAVAPRMVELSAGAQLIQRLGPAGRVWLPPPFLSGVFRPPRFAG